MRVRFQQAFLAQQDGKRIDFLARAATGHPDLQGGIGSQQWHHLIAQRQEVGRITRNISLTGMVRKFNSEANVSGSLSTLIL